MRLVLAEPNEPRGLDWDARLERGRKQVEARLAKVGAHVDRMDSETDYSYRAEFSFDGDLQPLVDYIEDVPGCEVLSIGHALEIVKDLGDAESVAEQYRLGGFRGTHGIGHVRMATESDVDISGAHPYWAYPFADLAVVHNGQLTNYHMWRRRLERTGHRFASECDSEIIAVYLAVMMERGVDLEIAMKQSMEDFDGVFTYLVVTEDALGVAKDVMAAKPLVVYESDDVVAVASEEVAIRAVMREEIDTHDPYEGEVLVWRSR
jgi:methylamine---glutamate N-methyltransferase subunit A